MHEWEDFFDDVYFYTVLLVPSKQINRCEGKLRFRLLKIFQKVLTDVTSLSPYPTIMDASISLPPATHTEIIALFNMDAIICDMFAVFIGSIMLSPEMATSSWSLLENLVRIAVSRIPEVAFAYPDALSCDTKRSNARLVTLKIAFVISIVTHLMVFGWRPLDTQD